MFDDTGYDYPEGFPLGDTNFTNKKGDCRAVVSTMPADTEFASTPRDLDGHGTHCASCAGGNANQNITA